MEGIAFGEAVFIFSNTPQPKPDVVKGSFKAVKTLELAL